MNETLSGLVKLLTEGDPDVQVAAAQVLGRLRAKESEVVSSLSRALHNGSAFLKPFALDALASIRTREAIEALLPVLDDTEEIRERPARAIASLGTLAEKSLLRQFEKGNPEVKRTIVQICARTRGKEASDLLEAVLTDSNEDLAHAAQESLLSEIPSMSPKESSKIAAQLSGLLRRGKNISHARASGLLLLLGSFRSESLRPLLTRYTTRAHAPVERAAALRALALLPAGSPATADLLSLLEENDFVSVVGPALEVVKKTKIPATLSGRLARLLKSERPEVRLFAIEAMGRFPTPASAKILMEHVGSADPRVRELVGHALAQNPASRAGLLKRLVAARDLEEARIAMEPLRGITGGLPPAALKELAERCHKLAEVRSPLRDVLAGLLWQANAAFTYQFFLDKAIRLRRSKKFAEAVRMMLFLASSGHLDAAGRYELVIGTLLSEPREIGTRVGDPVLGHIAELLAADFPLTARFRRESQLTADHLLYLGHHCAEKLQKERQFGLDMLKEIVRKWPGTKAAVQARQKLKVEGAG